MSSAQPFSVADLVDAFLDALEEEDNLLICHLNGTWVQVDGTFDIAALTTKIESYLLRGNASNELKDSK